MDRPAAPGTNERMSTTCEWMMFLGAGASMATPTNIPAFDPLRDAILKALGWNWDEQNKIYVHQLDRIAGVSVELQIPADPA